MNEIDLNELAIKTDSLPDAWKMLLIDPATGLPAKNITVARFIELLINKMPEATDTTKGLMSVQNLRTNPGNMFVNRVILDTDGLKPSNSYRIKVNKDYANFNIKILGGWTFGMAHGVLEKVISFGNGSANGTKVYKCSSPICNICYISDPYLIDNNVCVDIINKASGSNRFAVIVESFTMFTSYDFVNNQIPRAEDVNKNNRDETEFALKTSVNTLAASPNVLTDTISENYSIYPPPANCVPNSSESDSSVEQFAISTMSETDNPDGSIPVKTEPSEQYVWSIDKIGRAVLELQEENKRLKQILNISDDSEVQQM